MSITQLNLPDVIPLGCAIKNITFYDQLLSATLVTIAVIVLLNLASFEVIHFLPECCVPWKSQWCDRQARNVLRPWFRCCYRLDANRNNPFTVRGPQLISRGTAIIALWISWLVTSFTRTWESTMALRSAVKSICGQPSNGRGRGIIACL